MHMANIGVALKKLPAGISGRVKLVFVTTDPERDTAVALRRWLDHFNPLFIGLTGTEAALEAVQKSAGVPPCPQERTPQQRLFSRPRQLRYRIHERQSGPRDLSRGRQ
jgi:protein SCO1/2